MCHDTSQHPGGSISLKNADTGAVYLYDPANPSTQKIIASVATMRTGPEDGHTRL